MPQSYKVNVINSLVFIVCSLIGFLAHYLQWGNYTQTALIPFVLGMLLLVMTPGMKSGNKLIRTAVVTLTLIFGLIVLVMLVNTAGNDKTSARKTILLTVIALSCFISFGIYLNNWKQEKRKTEK
jgi:peptidoglycan/LPS O-acetylase OafA/YrhL